MLFRVVWQFSHTLRAHQQRLGKGKLARREYGNFHFFSAIIKFIFKLLSLRPLSERDGLNNIPRHTSLFQLYILIFHFSFSVFHFHYSFKSMGRRCQRFICMQLPEPLFPPLARDCAGRRDYLCTPL